MQNRKVLTLEMLRKGIKEVMAREGREAVQGCSSRAEQVSTMEVMDTCDLGAEVQQS